MQQNHKQLEESPTKLEISSIKNDSKKQSEIELVNQNQLTNMNHSMRESERENLCIEENTEKPKSQRISQQRILSYRQSIEIVKLKYLYEQYFDWLLKDGELIIIKFKNENGKIYLNTQLKSGYIQEEIIQNHKKKNLIVHLKDVNGKNYTKVTCQKLSLKQIEEELKFEKKIELRQLEKINNHLKQIEKLQLKIKDLEEKIPEKYRNQELEQGKSIQLKKIELQNQLNQLEDDEILNYQFDDGQKSCIQQQISDLVQKEKPDILQQQVTNLEQQLNQLLKKLSEDEKLHKIQSEKIDELVNSKNESEPIEFRVLESYQGEYDNKEKKHGQGKLIQYENEFIIEYQGEWVKGKKEGKGILTKYSRDPDSKIYQRYEGNFHKDLFTGQGKKFYNKNNTKFQEGQFKKGQEVGEHILTLIVNNQPVRRRKIYYNYCFFIKLVYEEPI